MTISLIRPVGGFVSSPFGMRGGVLHAGVDLAVGKGTPIHAAAAGTVVRAAWFDGYGNCVDINHGGNVMTRYGHMMQLPSVKAGQTVTQGQVVGYVGATGDASGNHLHFEVRLNGKPVDPWPYINGKAVPSDGSTTVPSVPSTAENVGLLSSAKQVTKLFAILGEPALYIRLGMWFGGFTLIGLGLIFLMGGSPSSVTKPVAKYAKKGAEYVKAASAE